MNKNHDHSHKLLSNLNHPEDENSNNKNDQQVNIWKYTNSVKYKFDQQLNSTACDPPKYLHLNFSSRSNVFSLP